MDITDNNEDIKSFKCHTCNYETFDSSNFTKHQMSKKHKINIGVLDRKPLIERVFKCEECDYMSYSSSNYAKHLESKSHKLKFGLIPEIPKKERKIFHCECCNETFSTSSNFAVHKKSTKHKQKETGIDLKPIEHSYQCAFCNYKAKAKNSYIIHMHHCDNKPKNAIMILIGIKGIERQLEKLKDNEIPRYDSGKGIYKDPEVIAEKIKVYEEKLQSEIKRFNEARRNPTPVNVDDLIKKEFERNKCFKYLRDEEFEKLVEKAYKEMDDPDSD